MNERESIAAKIRALLAKTVENGCTEDEAIAAAKMAAKLLAKYNLTVDEAMLRENPFSKAQSGGSDPVSARAWKVGAAICKLTGCRGWSTPYGAQPAYTFFGFAHEVEIARYLMAICKRAMEQQWLRLNREYALFVAVRRNRKVGAFLDGMADRLAQRILALIPPRVPGTGLIVLRNSLIDAELAKQGIELQDKRARSSDRLDETYADGVAAANRVQLEKGLTGPTDGQRRLA